MYLPPETLDFIFEQLSEDPQGPHIDALKACNLTSTTFSTICEPHLYACVYLIDNNVAGAVSGDKPDPFDPQCRITPEHFSKILSKKPHVAKYVKRLGILLLQGGACAVVDESWWEGVEEIVLQLQLSKITWLKLYLNDLYRKPGPITRVITRVVSSPTLETLHLHQVSYFSMLEAMVPGHRIRHLTVGFSGSAHNPTPEDWHDKSISLESLIIENISMIALDLIGKKRSNKEYVLDVSSLKQLWIFHESLNEPLIHAMFTRCRKLEELVLWENYLDRGQAHPADVWGMTSPIQGTLRTLEIMLSRRPVESYANIHQDIEAFFAMKPKACYSSLTHLRLQLYIGADSGSQNKVEDLEFSALEEIIRAHKAFPRLCSIDICTRNLNEEEALTFGGWRLRE